MELIKASPWKQRKGMLTSRVVIRYRKSDNTYITHVNSIQDGKNVYFWGHYDMTKAQAEQDFKRRVKSL